MRESIPELATVTSTSMTKTSRPVMTSHQNRNTATPQPKCSTQRGSSAAPLRSMVPPGSRYEFCHHKAMRCPKEGRMRSDRSPSWTVDLRGACSRPAESLQRLPVASVTCLPVLPDAPGARPERPPPVRCFTPVVCPRPCQHDHAKQWRLWHRMGLCGGLSEAAGAVWCDS